MLSSVISWQIYKAYKVGVDMYILGLNAYHGDSSACLVHDGRLVAAVEEERFRRVKHWAGFSSESIREIAGSS